MCFLAAFLSSGYFMLFPLRFNVTLLICLKFVLLHPSDLSDQNRSKYEKPTKGLMKNSSYERSFVLKVAPNHRKRYSELPKAILCNILKYN